MNIKTQKGKLILAIGLFTSFILAFFMDFTGLELHQWIGIAAGGVAVYHLVTHWSWVQAVTARFFGQTSAQARLYYLIDAALFCGFTGILFTGLVVSTWLNLALVNYEVWRVMHVWVSILTLVAVIAKVGVHWRWIVKAVSHRPAPAAVGMAAPARAAVAVTRPAGERVISRREFIKVMGITGVAAAIALSKAASSIQASVVETLASADPTAAATSAAANTPSAASQVSNVPAATATAAPTSAPAATAAVVASSSASAGCVVRCGRACSFPGHCRRYTDGNANNRCDLGECL